MEKKNALGILAVVFLAIVLVAGFFIFRDAGFLSSTGSLSQPSPYVCPASASYCDVTGRMYCDETTDSNPVVIARASSPSYGENGHWVAVSNEFNQLQGWYEEVSSSRANWGTGRQWIRLPYSYWGFEVTSGTTSDKGFWIYENPSSSEPNIPSQGNYRYFRYKQTGSGANLNPSPQDNCQNTEICSGSIGQYTCQGQFRVETLGGQNVISPKTLSCSSGSPCSDSETARLNPSEVVSVTGGDRNIIFYSEVDLPSCVQNECVGTSGYIPCQDGDELPFVACDTANGFMCSAGSCQAPFNNVQVVTKDKNGITTNGFNQNEPFDVFVTISTQLGITKVKAKVNKGSPLGTLVQEKESVFSSGQTKKFSFDGIVESDTYFVVLEVYFGSEGTIIYGTESDERTQFSVSPSFTAVFQPPFQEIDGEINTQNLYQNYPVTVILLTTSGTNVFVDYDPVLTGRIGGVQFTMPQPVVSRGSYEYTFVPDMSGQLSIEGNAVYGGVSKPISVRADIIPEDVVTEFTIIANKNVANIGSIPPSMQIGQTYLFEFETRNRGGQLINVDQNIVKVDDGAVVSDISSSVISTSTGTYEFSFTPTKRTGYQFTLRSIAAGLVNSREENSGLLQSTDEPPVLQCTVDSDCAFWQSCNSSGRCETRVGLIISIVLGVIFLVLIIIFVVRYIRNRREDSFGDSYY